MDIRKRNNRYTRNYGTPKPIERTRQRNVVRRSKRRRIRKNAVIRGAESRLKGFRQASILAVAITGFILMIFSADETFSSEELSSELQQDTLYTDTTADTITVVQGTEQAAGEAIGALQTMWNNFIFNYPKILIALGILIIAWFLVKLLKLILGQIFKKAKSRGGILTLTSIVVWILAIGIAFSVVVGDIRALVGSFGLIGLALSWALQTPIESFTGWLMNAFRRYYQVGDRILVGDVFGDVYRIDFLSTTVWEIGSPFQPGFVGAEQPTGRLVTFPNNEILTGTVVNLTGDFPYVWDELDVVVANESDLPFTMEVLRKVAMEVIGDYMALPAKSYSQILNRAGYLDEVSEYPEVFLSLSDSWTDVIIRYLVGARERRKWKTEMILKITAELNKPDYKGKIKPVYPRQQIQIIDPGGAPIENQPPLKDNQKE